MTYTTLRTSTQPITSRYTTRPIPYWNRTTFHKHSTGSSK